MAKVIAFFGSKSWVVEAEGEERKLFNMPHAVLQNGEKVELAFRSRGGWGWDTAYFTNMRILFRSCSGCMGKKVEYKSIPYSTIKGYSVDTPSLIDTDVEVVIHSSGMPMMTFVGAPAGCDTMAVMRVLNNFVLPGGAKQAAEGQTQAYSGDSEKEGKKGGFMDLLGGDARQIPPGEIEPKLKADPTNILMPNETVEMAFKCGRDTTIFTTHRLLIMDVQGITGKKVLYTSILWKSVRAFEVQTAGTLLDRDCEMTIFTNISADGLKKISTDLNKDKVDLLAIQRFYCDKILGVDTMPPSEVQDKAEGKEDKGSSLFGWIGDDCRQIDASLVNEKFHSTPDILQGSERVEMAFKGRRDLTLFTNKRLLVVDYKGLISKKTKYTSIPWTTIKVFAVRSAGSWGDKDSELMLWTDIMHDWEPQGDDKPPLAVPGMSYLEQDFSKDKVDLMAVHRYLSQRILAASGGQDASDVVIECPVKEVSEPSSLSKFLGKIGGDAHAVDPDAMTADLQQNGMIQADEKVLMSLKCGKDYTNFTNKRIFLMDHQRSMARTSKKMEYKSIPYTSVLAFEVESAGTFDSDAEAKFWCKNYWDMSVVEQDMRKGKVDIMALQSLLCSAIFGGASTESGLEAPPAVVQPEGGFGSLMGLMKGDGAAFDAGAAEELLKGSPKILMDDEKVDMAFKCGRDMVIYTTKRLLQIDVKGWTGKKIAYTSTPFKSLRGFAVQTAGGCCDFDSEAFLYTDIPGHSMVKTTMKKDNTGGIFTLQKLLANKKLRESTETEMEEWEARTGKWAAADAAKLAEIEKAKAEKAAKKNKGADANALVDAEKKEAE